MKKSTGLIMAVLILLFNINCGSREEKSAPSSASLSKDSSSKPTADNSQNSLDWNGIYKGVLPCADCEGIETSIRLDTNRTYSLRTKYLGKPGDDIEIKGKFRWNQEGNTITLEGILGGPNQYFVGENNITQLDMSGKKITGDLASKYILTKQATAAVPETAKSNATLTETYWKLFELMGKTVEPAKEGKKEVYLILKKEGSQVEGFAGCNSLAGTYELRNGNFISLKKLVSTMMACPDMKVEDQFKKVLGMVDNYSILGDTLSLNRARMAPLAKFVAVYPKKVIAT